MDNQPFSPPVETKIIESSMDFPTAIKKVIEGNRIARMGWNNDDYGFLSSEGWLSIKRDGEFFVWKVNDGDMKSIDWITV